jgi:hypothetical protein
MDIGGTETGLMPKANQKGVHLTGRTTHLDQRITGIVAGCGMAKAIK